LSNIDVSHAAQTESRIVRVEEGSSRESLRERPGWRMNVEHLRTVASTGGLLGLSLTEGFVLDSQVRLTRMRGE
jgi:hypothetical protein